jgi:ABC-type transport system involved in cytochrome c biogenesis ATPase subunit
MPVQTLLLPSANVLVQIEGVSVVAGLNAVTGDEGSGKTRFLRQLCDVQSNAQSDAQPNAIWLDLKLPEHDEQTPLKFWSQLERQYPKWNASLCEALSEALNLSEHLGKRLFMLSSGSRRKVALVALLSSGAQFTCLDQAFSALDHASIQVLCDFLNDMADNTERAWLLADYEADTRLKWAGIIHLP